MECEITEKGFLANQEKLISSNNMVASLINIFQNILPSL